MNTLKWLLLCTVTGVEGAFDLSSIMGGGKGGQLDIGGLLQGFLGQNEKTKGISDLLSAFMPPKAAPTTTPPTEQWVHDNAELDVELLGCFNHFGQILPRFVGRNQGYSPKLCVDDCLDSGYTAAGLRSMYMCFCGRVEDLDNSPFRKSDMDVCLHDTPGIVVSAYAAKPQESAYDYEETTTSITTKSALDSTTPGLVENSYDGDEYDVYAYGSYDEEDDHDNIPDLVSDDLVDDSPAMEQESSESNMPANNYVETTSPSLEPGDGCHSDVAFGFDMHLLPGELADSANVALHIADSVSTSSHLSIFRRTEGEQLEVVASTTGYTESEIGTAMFNVDNAEDVVSFENWLNADDRKNTSVIFFSTVRILFTPAFSEQMTEIAKQVKELWIAVPRRTETDVILDWVLAVPNIKLVNHIHLAAFDALLCSNSNFDM